LHNYTPSCYSDHVKGRKVWWMFCSYIHYAIILYELRLDGYFVRVSDNNSRSMVTDVEVQSTGVFPRLMVYYCYY